MRPSSSWFGACDLPQAFLSHSPGLSCPGRPPDEVEVPAQGAGVTGAVEAPAQKCWEAQELTWDGGPRPFTCPFLSTPPGRL